MVNAVRQTDIISVMQKKGGDKAAMDIQITPKQEAFITAAETEVLFGGAAG